MSTVKEALNGLKAQVADLKTVGTSAVALIEGLATKLETAISTYGEDPEALKAEIQQIATGLNEAKQELADAVSENTPAAGGENGAQSEGENTNQGAGESENNATDETNGGTV